MKRHHAYAIPLSFLSHNRLKELAFDKSTGAGTSGDSLSADDNVLTTPSLPPQSPKKFLLLDNLDSFYPPWFDFALTERKIKPFEKTVIIYLQLDGRRKKKEEDTVEFCHLKKENFIPRFQF